MTNTQSQMPMGQSVMPMPPQAPSLAIPGGASAVANNTLPMPPQGTSQGVTASPTSSPYPAPGAPTQPFWKVRQQNDGSSVDFIELPDGSERVIAIHDIPKIPKALQPVAAA